MAYLRIIQLYKSGISILNFGLGEPIMSTDKGRATSFCASWREVKWKNEDGVFDTFY